MSGDVTLPTPGEVEAMRGEHVREECFDGTERHCGGCSQAWPCDAARLLALVDSLRNLVRLTDKRLARAEARLDAVLAECDSMEHEYPYRRAEDIARIRRAATGEAPMT